MVFDLTTESASVRASTVDHSRSTCVITQGRLGVKQTTPDLPLSTGSVQIRGGRMDNHDHVTPELLCTIEHSTVY